MQRGPWLLLSLWAASAISSGAFAAEGAPNATGTLASIPAAVKSKAVNPTAAKSAAADSAAVKSTAEATAAGALKPNLSNASLSLISAPHDTQTSEGTDVHTAFSTEVVADKIALICHPSSLNECLASLSLAGEPLPQNLATELTSRLGYRSALAAPLDHPSIAGIVLWAPEREFTQLDAIIDGKLYTLPLKQQAQLTLWHELGHLHVERLRGSVLPNELSAYEHEALADAYLYWRIAREYGDLTLAWQQFHRRNLQVMSDINHLSHWSSLSLLPLLTKYSAVDLASFADFDAFCQHFCTSIKPWNDADLGEFASLMHQLFASPSLGHLSHYLSWRKPALSPVIRPTIEHLLGLEPAKAWLARSGLLLPG